MTEKEIVDIAESMGMYRDGDIWFSNTPDYQDVLTTDLVILVNRAIEKELKKQAEKFEQRTWVGLKDDDEIPWDGVDAKSFARAIEAKLKEKNGY